MSKSKVALACLLCALASSSMAASDAAASLTNLKFQLIDLNPLDGIAPTVTYNGGKTSLSLSISDAFTGNADSASRSRSGYQAFSHVYDVSLDNVEGFASIDAQTLAVYGAAQGASTSYNAQASTFAQQLTLSAQSMLVITAEASVTARAVNPQACPGNYYYYYGCSASETASASAGMSLNYNYYTNNSSVSVSFNDSLNVSATGRGEYSSYYYSSYPYYNYVYQTYPKLEETNASERMLTAVFMNTSTTNQSAYFSLSTSVNGQASSALPLSYAALTPVPEADTAALALVGLAGLISVRSLRRRRQA